MREPLIIVGGSVRAAAMSAVRAGFDPIAIDRYADADLWRISPRSAQFSELSQLPELADSFEPSNLIFVGPLENHPTIIGRLSKRHRLLGNYGTDLQHVRDPWRVAAVLTPAGLPSPDLRPSDDNSLDGEWLVKPLASAGGLHIERFDSGSRQGATPSHYLQQYVRGTSIGATFLAAAGKSQLLGVTEQLVGTEWNGSRPFQYIGSIGPTVLSPEQTLQLVNIGSTLADSFQLRGLFGVDAIVNDEGVWTVEVNPRYTASVEIIERAMNINAMRLNVEACTNQQLAAVDSRCSPNDVDAIHGKAIVYATQSIVISNSMSQDLLAMNTGRVHPVVADIPVSDTSIGVDEPIATVFATGTTITDVKQRLRDATADLKKQVGDTSPSV